MKPIFCLFTFALVIVAGCHAAFACTCSLEGLDDVKKLVQEQDRLFFIGEVIKVVEIKAHDQVTNRDIVFSRHITFKVRNNWKRYQRATIKIVTGSSNGGCGYRFTEKETYFIDATQRNGEYETSICTLTNKLANAQYEIAELDKWKASQRAGRKGKRTL